MFGLDNMDLSRAEKFMRGLPLHIVDDEAGKCQPLTHAIFCDHL